MGRFIEQRALPVRTIRYTSGYYLGRATTIWHLLMLSLPVDLLLLSLLPYLNLPALDLSTPLLGAAGIALIGSMREQLLGVLDRGRTLHAEVAPRAHRLAPFLLAGLVLFAIVDALLRTGAGGVLAPLAAGIVGIGAFLSGRRMVGEARARFAARERDPLLEIEQTNQQIFLFALLPMVAARSVSFLGVLTAGVSPGSGMLYIVAGLILLGITMPQREHFIVTCRRCSRWTSRALRRFECCPACAREDFQIQETEKRAGETVAPSTPAGPDNASLPENRVPALPTEALKVLRRRGRAEAQPQSSGSGAGG